MTTPGTPVHPDTRALLDRLDSLPGHKASRGAAWAGTNPERIIAWVYADWGTPVATWPGTGGYREIVGVYRRDDRWSASVIPIQTRTDGVDRGWEQIPVGQRLALINQGLRWAATGDAIDVVRTALGRHDADPYRDRDWLTIAHLVARTADLDLDAVRALFALNGDTWLLHYLDTEPPATP